MASFPKAWVSLNKAAEAMEITIPNDYKETAWLISIFDDPMLDKLRTKFMHSVIIQSEKRSGQPYKDIEIDHIGLFNHILPYIWKWENMFGKTEIGEQDWEKLPPDERIPEKFPRRTKKFYRRVEIPQESKEQFQALVKRDLMYFAGALFLNRQAAMDSADEWEYETEVKNFETGLTIQ